MAEISWRRSGLQSGIRVITEAVPGVRSVSLGLWIDTGSRDESDGEVGLTHFLEHLLFKGTPGMSARDIAEQFDNLGADINAVTGKEHTSVYSRVLDQYFPEALHLVMDMVRNSSFDAKEMDFERKVVLEEIAMHMDSPDELVHDHLALALWGKHPIGHMVLGEAPVIMNTTRDQLVAFENARYVTDRIVVAAAGAVDHDDLCALMEKESSGMRRGAQADRADSMPDPLSTSHFYFKETEQAHICLGAKGLPRNHDDRFALAVLDNMLGGSMSSRLFQRIREQRGLAYAIYSYNSMFLGMGMVGIYCGTQPAQAAKVLSLIEEELASVGSDGFSEEEVSRTKNHMKGSLFISQEDSGNRMSRIAKSELAGGEHLMVEEMVKRVEAVGDDDLRRVYRETWGSARPCLAVVGPIKEGELELAG